MPASFGPRAAILAAAVLLASCADTAPTANTSATPADTASAPATVAPSPPPASPATSNIGPAPSAPPPALQCGSPTAHVYHPYRLRLIDACKTVSGTIATIRSEADGDYHVLLSLDPQYASLLQPANNSGEHGDLVLEPICQHTVTQADAVAPCQGAGPFIPIPPVGTHVSATGSYVYDLDHGGWAELHPLFEIHAG